LFVRIFALVTQPQGNATIWHVFKNVAVFLLSHHVVLSRFKVENDKERRPLVLLVLDNLHVALVPYAPPVGLAHVAAESPAFVPPPAMFQHTATTPAAFDTFAHGK